MKPKTYVLLERAIEEGCATGWRHAFKHRNDAPPENEDDILDALHRDIMAAICEVFSFDDEC